MLCQGCTKKCGNEHCAFSFNIVEASQSGQPFKRIGSDTILICNDDGFFRYLTNRDTGEVYNPSQDDFLAEYTLSV